MLIYPQAAQPTGPPLHPLYRANFALGEVSGEVTHMLRNQPKLCLENLLRAIALSKALVNDLVEAHQVLLSPESYPQYYPPVPQPPPPPQRQPPPQHQPPPQQQPTPQRQPPPPPQQPDNHHHRQDPTAPTPAPPPPQQQRPDGMLSRIRDGKFIIFQPLMHQTAPGPHTPAPVSRSSQQAGEHQWLIGTGAGRFNSRSLLNLPPRQQAPPPPPPQQQQQAVSQIHREEETTRAPLKRSYASQDGPGMTTARPFELEEGNGVGGAREKRRLTTVGAEEGRDVGPPTNPGGVAAAKDIAGENPPSRGPVSHRPAVVDDEDSTTQPDGNASHSDKGKDGAAPRVNQAEGRAIKQEAEADEPNGVEGVASGQKDRVQAVQEGSDAHQEHSEEDNGTVDNTQNGTRQEASAKKGADHESEGDCAGPRVAEDTSEEDNAARKEKVAVKTEEEEADVANVPVGGEPTEDGDRVHDVSVAN